MGRDKIINNIKKRQEHKTQSSVEIKNKQTKKGDQMKQFPKIPHIGKYVPKPKHHYAFKKKTSGVVQNHHEMDD